MSENPLAVPNPRPGQDPDQPRRVASLRGAMQALERAGVLDPRDTVHGRLLALRPAESWGSAEMIAAADIVARHRSHLAALRIDFRRLPSPATASAVDEARQAMIVGARRVALSSLVVRRDGRIELRFPAAPGLATEAKRISGHERAVDGVGHVYPTSSLSEVIAFAQRHEIPVAEDFLRAVAAIEEPVPPADPIPVIGVRPDGYLEVVFSARTPLVYAVKALPGRRWDPQTRASVFPPRSAPAVVEFADAHGVPVSDEVRALAAVGDEARPQVIYDPAASVVVVDRDYQADLAGVLRAANDSIGVFDNARGAYVLTDRADAAQIFKIVERFGLAMDDAARQQLTRWRREQQRNMVESMAAASPRIDVAGVGTELAPHQRVAMSFVARNRRVLYADPPGFGQQAATLAAVEMVGEYPAVIVCPPSATRLWADLVSEVLPRRSAYVVASSGTRGIPEGAEVLIISAAALGLKLARQRGARHAPRFLWLPALLERRPATLLIDDGHLEHAPRSGRSRALYELAVAVSQRSGVIVDLTAADPVRLGHHQLARQATLLGRLDDTGDATHLRDRLAEDPDSVRRRLRSVGMLLRRSPQALPAVPAASIAPVYLDASECDQEALEAYRAAEAAWLARRAEQVTTIAAQLRVAVNHPRVARAISRDGAHQLAELRMLRRLLTQAKRPASAACIGRRREVGEKLLLAAALRDTVDDLAVSFRGLRIHSGRHADAVAAAVNRFRSDPDATVMAVALAEASVQDLTAAHRCIQPELGFTAGEVLRMLARIQRQGQSRPVTYEVLLAPSTIDEYLWRALDLDSAEGQRPAAALVDEKARHVTAAQAAWSMVCDALADRHTRAANPEGG